MPLRTAGGPSHHYQKLCEDTTGHHGPFCAHTAAERRPHDWDSSPKRSLRRTHSPHSPLDIHDRSGLDDWEREESTVGGSTGHSTGESTVTFGVGDHGFMEPHPGQKRGESCINEEYVEELAKEESKTLKVLGFASDSLTHCPTSTRERQLSCPTVSDEQDEDLRRGNRVLKAVRGKLEWTLLGEQAKGVFDEVFWRRRREIVGGRKETDGERRKRGGKREHDRYLMRREKADRRDGVENERREMRERWKMGMIEEAEQAGRWGVK